MAQALSHIQTRDRDEWAAGWGKVAQNYVDQAKSASSKADTSAAYKKAWRLYYFAQWPVPNSNMVSDLSASALTWSSWAKACELGTAAMNGSS